MRPNAVGFAQRSAGHAQDAHHPTCGLRTTHGHDALQVRAVEQLRGAGNHGNTLELSGRNTSSPLAAGTRKPLTRITGAPTRAVTKMVRRGVEGIRAAANRDHHRNSLLQHGDVAVRHQRSLGSDERMLARKSDQQVAPQQGSDAEVEQQAATLEQPRELDRARAPCRQPPEEAGLGRCGEGQPQVPPGWATTPIAPRPLLNKMMKNITFQKSATRA